MYKSCNRKWEQQLKQSMVNLFSLLTIVNKFELMYRLILISTQVEIVVEAELGK